MDNAIIRPATPDDFQALGMIGAAAYAESYNYLWDNPAAYAAYLQSFRPQTFEGRPGESFVWVIDVDGWLVGFLRMVPFSPDPVENQAECAEIHRIYLLKPCRGHGLGLKLLAVAEQQAMSLGLESLWLVSMRSATWAWRSYERWGFTKIAEIDFNKPVIESERHLVVMKRKIPWVDLTA